MEDTAANIDPNLLKKIYLFRSINLESIQGIFDFCKVHNLKEGEILLRPGQSNWTIYFLLKGRLRIHLNTLDSDPVTVLGPGESVGELSVIDQQPTTAFVAAAEDSLLVSMDEDILWSLVHSSHAIACNLLYTLAKRLRHADSVVSGGVYLDREERHYGNVDALTGLPNREWFDQLLKRQCLRSHHAGKSLSLILMDIDGFNAFNDSYGRRCGDRVLYSMACGLNHHLRPTEMMARYGSNLFSILLPDADMETARGIAVRLFKSIEQASPVMAEGKMVDHPSVSVGVAQMKPEHDGESLFSDAEAALCRAKQKGGNAISE
ncbi:MAG: GGDEF domain-containing protein [Syntrophales bacterium]